VAVCTPISPLGPNSVDVHDDLELLVRRSEYAAGRGEPDQPHKNRETIVRHVTPA
jgi:hypothetical protein